jgi:hypothetical protein
MSRWRTAVLALAPLLVLPACSPGRTPPAVAPTTAPADPSAVVVTVDGSTPIATVDERFLSVGLDVAQVSGGRFWDPAGGVDPSATAGGGREVEPYDLGRRRLVTLLSELAPAYLRLGGTASDSTYVDIEGTTGGVPPDGFDEVLTAGQWDAVMGLVRRSGLDAVVTLDAGPGARDAAGVWREDRAEAVVRRAVERGDPVAAWALGNEPNYFGLNFGGPGPTAFAADYRRFRAVVDALDPDALVLGPATALWPGRGELFPVLEEFLAAGAGTVDVVTWHYYPQQSERCPARFVPAEPDRALDPTFLSEFDVRASWVGQRAAAAGGRPVWLEETGNAQCGGQPGLSDRYLAGIWWLDQLGRAARHGQQVVVRWNVSGADYGLLREPDLDPNPDYWNSLLWRRLMGRTVLEATPPAEWPTVVVYAHCTPGRQGSVTVLVLNLDPQHPVSLRLEGVGNSPLDAYVLDAAEPLGREVRLNGRTLALVGDRVPALEPVRLTRASFEVPAASYAFVRAPGAGAPACGGAR